ncbi:MAG: hypothetical protein GX643_09835 [Acidimicrobiales bacterium]|nr:hypothetical protein [Acidimicrobiales bacterium]
MTDAPGPDPLSELRLPVAPLAPRPDFARDLRRQVEAALRPAPPITDPPATEEATMATTETTTATTTTSPSAARTKPALSPYLAVPRATEAIDWYRDVLGAVETLRYVGDDGRVGHCELVVGGSTIMLADEFPEMGVNGPGFYGGTSVMLHLEVVDVDYTFERAVAAGAQGQREPADQGHGNRNATIVDPYGHRWMLSQPLPDDAPSSSSDEAEAPGSTEAGTGGEATVDDGNASWTVTGRAPVEPGYITINPTDPARANAFFGTLFAWQVESAHPGGGGHVANTRFPMGIAPGEYGADAGHAPTTVYFRVDDPEHYAARVEELGGRVLARNDYDSGASISCEDDQGYRFELWQPAPGY